MPAVRSWKGDSTPTGGPAVKAGTTWRRPAITFAGLLLAYYAVPSGIGTDAGFVIGLALTAVALVVLAWAITGQVRRQLSGGTEVALQSLLVLIILVVVVFAYGFYTLERTRPGEVSGLDTRTDALYFTMTTMTTVGYGDVHATGQTARVLVMVQLAFNIIFVGALASIVSGQIRHRAVTRLSGRPGRRSDDDPA
jgi:voltage-gated potassium channel